MTCEVLLKSKIINLIITNSVIDISFYPILGSDRIGLDHHRIYLAHGDGHFPDCLEIDAGKAADRVGSGASRRYVPICPGMGALFCPRRPGKNTRLMKKLSSRAAAPLIKG